MQYYFHNPLFYCHTPMTSDYDITPHHTINQITIKTISIHDETSVRSPQNQNSTFPNSVNLKHLLHKLRHRLDLPFGKLLINHRKIYKNLGNVTPPTDWQICTLIHSRDKTHPPVKCIEFPR